MTMARRNTFAIDDLDAAALASLRRAWSRRAPDGAPAVALRELRFATIGTLAGASTSGEHQRRVAQLLAGTLPDTLAPCVRASSDAVAPVARSQVDWGAVEVREWRALAAMGLPADVRARLLDGGGAGGDDGDEERVRVRELVRELAAAVGATDGDLVGTVDAITAAVRETLLADALDAAAGHRGRAAEALGTAHPRVVKLLADYPHLVARWPGARGRPVDLDAPSDGDE